MKTITLSFHKQKVTIAVNKLKKEDKDFIKAFLTDDDERTNKQWDLVEKNSFYKLLKNLGYNPNTEEIFIEDYT